MFDMVGGDVGHTRYAKCQVRKEDLLLCYSAAHALTVRLNGSVMGMGGEAAFHMCIEASPSAFELHEGFSTDELMQHRNHYIVF